MQPNTAFSVKTVLQTTLTCSLLAIGVFCNGRASPDSNRFYEDDRIRVPLPLGWTAKQQTVTVTGDRTFESPIGGVLSKGKYRIYLLTHYGQASGIKGGRFGEIAKYVAPWIQLSDPWYCFDAFAKTLTPVAGRLSRVDLFLNHKLADQQSDPDCETLHSRTHRPVWFGSYFGELTPGFTLPGFFLSFPLEQSNVVPDSQMAFTAPIDANTAETLPSKNDRALQEFLREASAIVKSIQYK